MTRVRWQLWVWIVVAAALAGCGRAPEPFKTGRGYLLHLPGAMGYAPSDVRLLNGLSAGGIDAEIRVDPWNVGREGFGLLAASQLETNRAAAKRAADRLAEVARASPDRPMYVTGQSAGGGAAVFVLEALPRGVQVEHALLISPALSPDYDLSKALSRVRGKMYVVYSPRDTLVLGWGTRTYGNIDGRRSDAAGLVGFVVPASADRDAYSAKLVQLKWEPSWRTQGHDGGHIGALTVKFGKERLAKLLLAGQ